MNTAFPFLTAYDPPGTSEGTLDPLGLYQIADQLAVQLVPAVRERMQRIRFVTAMAVGALVTEGLEDDPRNRDASPYLVWEWLVVEALLRTDGDDRRLWGVPGTVVGRRALKQYGYLDARSYLKTPRIFGFHAVYKRLATHLGLVNVHLEPGPNTEGLVHAWARGLGLSGFREAKSLLGELSAAVRRSLKEKPPRTNPGWGARGWDELAKAFNPPMSKAQEKRYLRNLLLASNERRLGALPAIWELQAGFSDDKFSEEALHSWLKKQEPRYRPLLEAIRAYETFARSLQDAFDVLKAEAAGWDTQGYEVQKIARDPDFKSSVKSLHLKFESAHRALGDAALPNLALQNQFDRQFAAFAVPLPAAECALAICTHHVVIQKAKSADGKRPWFDRLGHDRIYIRHAYREPRREIQPGRYVHDYRGRPIRRFYEDLT